MRKKNPQRESVESAVAYIVIRKLMKDVKETDAYKLGLIDKRYNILREPKTEEEELALNPLNLLIFKLRQVLGPNISRLFRFLYLNNYDEDKYMDSLLVKGMLKSNSDIMRVVKELQSKW